MEVILQTTDITQIPFVKMLLSSEGIETYVFDQNISVLEGSINIFPIRIMVLVKDSEVANRVLKENGILKGSINGFKRILSCHPIKFLGGGEGFDPVKKKK